MGKPVHRYRHFKQAGNFERLGMRVPGERLESKLRQTLRRYGCAAVPWRGENGIRLCPEQLSQAALPVFNVTALGQVVSCGAKLAFLAVRLVVDVRIPVLMNAQAFRMGRHSS